MTRLESNMNAVDRMLSLMFRVIAPCFISASLSLGQIVTSKSVSASNWSTVSFVDTSVGWIAGDTRLMRTTNGGDTWIETKSLSGSFYSVSACGTHGAWVCWFGYQLSFLGRTTDSGATWDTLKSSCMNCISDIYFAHVKARDSSRVWVVEGGSILADYVVALKTSNGGKSWNYYLPQHGSPMSFTALDVAPDSGVATLFARKYLFRSTNDGSNWQQDNLPLPCNALSLRDTNHLWVVGDSGLIYHSTSFDHAPSEQSSGLIENLNAVAAVDDQNVWVAGDGGTIATTTDGGVNWQKIPVSTTANLNSICFIDANHGWIVGDSGTVLRIRYNSITSVAHSSSPAMRFSLQQNYPNPFNPSTTISFHLGMTAFVTLKAFDINGREVAAILSGTFPPGEHFHLWTPGDLPSGIYFCRLQAGTFHQTKKLLLLK
jgi:photosystem II stability/assembly factor-like uncharacterized protein